MKINLSALVLLALAMSATVGAERALAKPNVLFLFADDMRADTIAAHGNSHIRTPNLDSLAARGFSFHGNYV
jgi:arylsulfatase A-like enzyme